MSINIFPKTLFGFYWQMVKKFWPFAVGLIGIQVAFDALYKSLPGLSIKWISDSIEAAAPSLPLIPQVLPVVIILTGLFVLMFFADWAASFISGKYAPLIKSKVGEILYDKMSHQSVAFFKDNSAGYLVEQGNLVRNNFQKICVTHVQKILGLIAAIGINMTLMFTVHWTVAALFAVCASVRIFHCSFRMKGMIKNWVNASKLAAQVTSKHVDSISNFMNIKLFARKNDERLYLNKIRLKHARARQKANKSELYFWLFPFGFEQMCMIALLFLLLHLYGLGVMNLGNFAFSFTAFATMMSMIRGITWTMPDIIDDIASAHQAYNAVAKPLSIYDTPKAKCIDSKSCEIQFDNITFGYGEETIFKNLNICIKPGEKVGLVGLSGSGKSTLLYLLMRLYDVKGGAIKIGGQDIRKATGDSLRGMISFVPQDCTLFNRTLSENIAYGAKAAKKSDVIESAKKAEAHDFIMKMDEKYDTVVGDRGVKLSGGQRQRIAIAHAICKNSPIIVMDEATSALDSKTEVAIQKTLKNTLRGKTALVVAHRLSTLRQMDRIIVLDKGKIVETGKHSELVKNKKGIYCKLWTMQSDGFIK